MSFFFNIKYEPKDLQERQIRVDVGGVAEIIVMAGFLQGALHIVARFISHASVLMKAQRKHLADAAAFTEIKTPLSLLNRNERVSSRC